MFGLNVTRAQRYPIIDSLAVSSQEVEIIDSIITRNPLKPHDTGSPRATMQSFIENINRSYKLLKVAQQENIASPGLFTPKSIKQKAQKA
jgi:hypothetical protein